MKRTALPGIVIIAAVLFMCAGAMAAPQCFQPFSGVYIRFEQPLTSTTTAQHGRVWGALSPCDGLASWPIVGSSHHSKKDGLVVAFRAFTVDANTCGAVDYIGTLKGKPLSGPFELFNQRSNFGTTGTWTQISCPAPPTHRTEPPAGVDVQGNFVK